MGVWKKSPRADPAEIARIQAQIAPWMAELQQQAWGNPSAFQRIPAIIKQRLAAAGLRLPDGYDVSMDGEVVYTNKTPYLQQAAWAATPFVGGYGAEKLANAFAPAAAGTGTAAATSPAAGLLPSSSFPVPLWTGPGRIASQNASRGGNPLSRLWGGVKRVGETVGGNGTDLNAWQRAALAALAGLPALIAAKSSAGMSDEEKALYQQMLKDMEQDRGYRTKFSDQDLGFRSQDEAVRGLQLGRMQQQNPLFEAVTRLAMNRLPTDVQQPIEKF